MLLYIDLRERTAFDADVLERTLLTAGAIKYSSPGVTCVAAFDYSLGDDMTTIRIPGDLETVNLDGTGLASFDIAWRLQKNCPKPIHIVDEQYNFDYAISDFDSLESLMHAANEAMNE